MNFYLCRKEIRDNFTDNDMKFLCELSSIARKHNAQDIHDRVGYEVLGPMLLGYTQWLHREAVNRNARMIVFIAREGLILKRAYEYLYGNSSIKTIYINVSRVSACRASMVYTKNFDDMLHLFSNNLLQKDKTMREFFSVIGIGESIYDDYPGLSQKLSDVDDRDRLYDFIIRRGMTYFYNQNILLKKYLADKGITQGTAIVSDVGYSGSMQSLLGIITPGVHYVGRYIITRKNSRYKDNFIYQEAEMSGYWSSSPGKWNGLYDVKYIPQATPFFETLFLSVEGTTLEYAENTVGG